jgi:hypothetical protein
MDEDTSDYITSTAWNPIKGIFIIIFNNLINLYLLLL